MNTRLISFCALLLVVVGGWIFLMHEQGADTIHSNIFAAKRQQLETAVFAAEANAECGYSDLGYAYYSPRETAERLVEAMNAAQMLTEGEGEELKNVSLPKPTKYTLDKPTDVWQVVVRGDEEKNILWIEGYGLDLEKALIARKVKCF